MHLKQPEPFSPVGNGSQKSADTCNHGPFGVGDIFRVSGWELLVLAWQGMQLAIFLQFHALVNSWKSFRGALHGRS